MSVITELPKRIVGYAIHDVIGNCETCLTNYDPDYLKQVEDSGLLIIAVYEDESRCVVKAEDVEEPVLQVNGITLTTPEYVDARTQATVAVFDALAAIVNPETSTLSEDDSADSENPVESFSKALGALKALVAGQEG